MASDQHFEPKNRSRDGGKPSPADELISFLDKNSLPLAERHPSNHTEDLATLRPSQLLELAHDTFDFIRLLVKYAAFDLEASERESVYLLGQLRKQLGEPTLDLSSPRLASVKNAFATAESARIGAIGGRESLDPMGMEFENASLRLSQLLTHLRSIERSDGTSGKAQFESRVDPLLEGLTKVRATTPLLLERIKSERKIAAELRFILDRHNQGESF